ncbi:MAG: substrate-binding domain-containing protein [bacterium]|nr:substrate-binding domain-containing protein [bacterium]
MKPNSTAENHGLDLLVVISLRWTSGRDILSGIFRYLANDFRWNVHIVEPEQLTAATLKRGMPYAGYLITRSGTDEAMRILERSDVPTVLINIDDRNLAARERNISFVWLDNSSIGRIGAEHLLAQSRFKSYGFVFSHEDDFYNRERESAFRLTLKAANRTSTSFCPKDQVHPEREIAHWLKGLPKPAGIMACTDLRGIETIRACEKAGLSIPEAVSVLGVGDDLSRSNKISPSLSSVNPNHTQLGFAAMQELDRIVCSSGRHKPQEIVVPATFFIARQSTTANSTASELVEKAMAFITENRGVSLRPSTVARTLGCSLRLLEQRFRKIRDTSLRAEIERIRMQGVLDELAHGKRNVAALAEKLHFKSANQLSRIFKRHFGKTITDHLREPSNR